MEQPEQNRCWKIPIGEGTCSFWNQDTYRRLRTVLLYELCPPCNGTGFDAPKKILYYAQATFLDSFPCSLMSVCRFALPVKSQSVDSRTGAPRQVSERAARPLDNERAPEVEPSERSQPPSLCGAETDRHDHTPVVLSNDCCNSVISSEG